MESINGWIKAELFMDFHVTGNKPVINEINDYILFFNEQRPTYSLNYLTPVQYRESFPVAAGVRLQIILSTYSEISRPIFVDYCRMHLNEIKCSQPSLMGRFVFISSAFRTKTL